MEHGLSGKTLNTIRNILRSHPEVDVAILFGSRAKGTYRPGSDIDLSLVGANLSHQILLRIMSEFDDSSIPYLVDLSMFDQIGDAAVRSHIHRMGQILYQKETEVRGPGRWYFRAWTFK